MKSIVDRFEPEDAGLNRSLNALARHGDGPETEMQKELQKETQKADGAEEGQESAVTILAEALAEAEGQFEITAKFYAPCVSCGDRTEIYCDIIDHDPDMHYCGKDPRCCP